MFKIACILTLLATPFIIMHFLREVKIAFKNHHIIFLRDYVNNYLAYSYMIYIALFETGLNCTAFLITLRAYCKSDPKYKFNKNIRKHILTRQLIYFL